MGDPAAGGALGPELPDVVRLLWFCLRNSMSTRRHNDLGNRGWFKELGDAAVALRRLRNTEEC